MPIRLSEKDVRRALGADHSHWVQDARAAWDSLTASGDSEWVALYELQFFLWYVLPSKFLASYEDKLAVAAALARLLEGLSDPTHAALCRSPATVHVVGAWESSSQAGIAAMRQAMEASGVDPPDLEDFRWGEVMGLEEVALHLHAAIVLEEAIDAGRLTPGRRGWQKAQSGITVGFLNSELERLHGRTPLQAIQQ